MAIDPEELAAANQAALNFHTTGGRDVRAEQYLHSRGITLPAGYQAGHSVLAEHLTAAGWHPDVLLAAGLCRNTAAGQLLDTFSGRIVFPIRAGDTVTGFIGRTERDGVEPKYVNIATTALFDKSSSQLYGLTEGTDRLAHEGVFPVPVEGPIDALAIAQHTPDLVPVAVMGTAVTDHHLAAPQTASPGKRIIVALDDAPAGMAHAHGADVAKWLHPGNCRRIIYTAVEHHITQAGDLQFLEQRVTTAKAVWAYLDQHYQSDPDHDRAADYAADLCRVSRLGLPPLPAHRREMTLPGQRQASDLGR
ncbi:toprim domain-containing protein [Nakamurella alba]|uniref:toprim domain-containing protein n=1 Tax=Nakamurella alba TaxID=2665158 RepID=UPI0018AA850C|nr:toprim domain-containing protein [Nakamurella alba]